MVQYVRDESKPSLPGALARALSAEDYKEGIDAHFEGLPDRYRDCNFSVTTLTRAPRQRVLHNRHAHKVIIDPMADIWKLWGHVVHSILEEHHDPDTETVEQRIGMAFTPNNRPGLLKGLRRNGQPFRTVYLHGQYDLFNNVTRMLSDWKVTKAIGMIYGARPENEAQLNVLKMLLENKGTEVLSMENVYLFREWNERDAARMKERGYPQEQFLRKHVPMWAPADTEHYVNTRLRLHLEAEMLKDDDLPPCTEEELWMTNPAYRVVKIDHNIKTNERTEQKTSKLTTGSKVEALAFMADPINQVDAKGKRIEYVLKEKPRQAMRCKFCDIRSWCNQHQEMQSHGTLSTEEEES